MASIVRTVVGLPLQLASSALAAPARAFKGIEDATAASRQLAGEAVELGRRIATSGGAASWSVLATSRRVIREAVTGDDHWWRDGRRLHLPVRLPAGDPARAQRVLRHTVVTVLEHPDVVSAHWDGGLARLVVLFTEETVVDGVAAEIAEIAQRCGLSAAEPEPGVHPGDRSEVRAAAMALAFSGAGLATALTSRLWWWRRPPRTASAVLSLVREDPRLRSVLRGRLGSGPTELVLAAAGALVHGFGQEPVEMLLDSLLRTGQLLGAVDRVSMFERAHDLLCGPDRDSVGAPGERPPMSEPVVDYASTASTGGMVGAVAAALVTRSLREAGDAVLAGSPKPARYGWSAYATVLAHALARDGVLVRDSERLRALQTVDTVLVHAAALRRDDRSVLEAHPRDGEWEDGRLWQAAEEALAPGAPGPVRLRPATGGADATGLMVASAGGRDIGTVLIGHTGDPVAEAFLDEAAKAGLRVVVLDDGIPASGTVRADDVVAPDESPTEVLHRLRADGHVVLTLARLPRRADEDPELLEALLGGDLTACLADRDAAVAWGADLLCVDGLRGAWRLLRAVPSAGAAGKHAVSYAQAAAVLSGLLVITGAHRWSRLFAPLARTDPVNLAAAAALLSGWTFATGVAIAPAPADREPMPWHALAADEVLRRVRAQARRNRRAAISVAEQAHRFAEHMAQLTGAVAMRAPVRLAVAVRAELRDPLTPVLAVGAGASAILGSTVDAALVLGAMLVNAVVGGVQRLRADHAMSALAASQQRWARVLDEDEAAPTLIDADDLAPGMIIELREGDVVPADARLLRVIGLEVDESALTGESLPVTKQLTATPASAIADRRCMVFEGTTVAAGHARAVVVGIGEDTESGRAISLASRTAPAAGVQARLRELTGKALPLTLAGGVVVTGLALLRGRPVREAIGGGVAVAVAAVPEGLPLVATVAQMAAARRLSRHGVLVRTPRALEALGRVDTVCFDKTGTLTENRLRVVKVATPDGTVHTAGEPRAAEIIAVAARACPRDPTNPGRQTHATDEAVVLAGPPGDPWSQIDGLPFEASRGYAAATGSFSDTTWLVVKGAPEIVLPGCADAPGGAGDLARTLAARGLRVLAVAQRRIDSGTANDVLEEPLSSLEFMGLLAMADTARPTATPLVRGLREAGVRPVMLTGDHPQTATAIAIGLGWPKDTIVVTGDELTALDRDGRTRLLREAGVVARVAPEQKLHVVEALREAGRVVAMVGDGANDAAAIRAAHVGVGVAARGSAAARNAADLVLGGEDFTAIVDAVREGRTLWRSVADAITILIGGNAGEVGFTVLGTLLSGTSPFSPRQLLLVNLLTDMFPAMAVAVTPPDAGEAPPIGDAPVGEAVLEGPLRHQIRRRGVVTGIGATTAWLVGAASPGTARRTSTMALCGLVGSQLVQTLSGRQRSPLVLTTCLGSAAALVAVVQTPGVSHFFGCTPLGPLAWAGVGTALAVPLVFPRLETLLTRAVPSLAPEGSG